MNWGQRSGACWPGAGQHEPVPCCELSGYLPHSAQARPAGGSEILLWSLVRTNSPYLRAEGYWGLEQYDQANEEFRIVRPNPTVIRSIRFAGACCCISGSTTRTRSDCSRSVQKGSENAQAYPGLAIVSANGFDERPGLCQKALVLDPKLVEAHGLPATSPSKIEYGTRCQGG